MRGAFCANTHCVQETIDPFSYCSRRSKVIYYRQNLLVFYCLELTIYILALFFSLAGKSVSRSGLFCVFSMNNFDVSNKVV